MGKHGGRHQDCDLLASLDGFECRADRHFGFAKPDIAADQAIHRAGAFHIHFRFLDGAQLVAGFGEGE